MDDLTKVAMEGLKELVEENIKPFGERIQQEGGRVEVTITSLKDVKVTFNSKISDQLQKDIGRALGQLPKE